LSLKEYSLKIIAGIDSKKIRSFEQLNNFKMKLSKEFGLSEVPTNPDILAFCKKPSELVSRMLSIKPVRSLSGVEVVAVMVAPHECPGKCIYCPNGIEEETPKSYTGKEPAARRAIMFGFNPFKQASNRIKQLDATGHKAEKIELIVMGGTFPSTPLSYQKWFVKRCLEAISEKKASSLAQAKANAEKSRRRVVGITFETRPDFCGKKEIKRMLSFGGTRVELGVQALSDEVYKKINRGHSVEDVVNATAFLKDSAFKVSYHLMPGLYGVSASEDMKLFRKAFEDERFMPDMLKIYPALVMNGTKLFELWKKGEYEPLSTEKAADFIARAKKFIPPWVRVMRVQRDIPSNLIAAGVKKSNLRQIVHKKMQEHGEKCRCIRCREAGLKKTVLSEEFIRDSVISRIDYSASNGKEIFLSVSEQVSDSLAGFCRLRIPAKPFIKQIGSDTGLIRELHVYGKALPLRKKSPEAIQHQGIGKKLVAEAERIASEDFDKKKIAIISGLGVREYYRKSFGYKDDGFYVSRVIS
jgi:elongator complex protein 3